MNKLNMLCRHLTVSSISPKVYKFKLAPKSIMGLADKSALINICKFVFYVYYRHFMLKELLWSLCICGQNHFLRMER